MNALKTPLTQPLEFPKLMRMAQSLSCEGRLSVSKNHLLYLDVDNQFIIKLLPLLNDPSITNPNYFGKEGAGAHISVIYPEEKIVLQNESSPSYHIFQIKKLAIVTIHEKNYYALLVESASLLSLRKKYGLSDQLTFKGYSIGFHITIGTKLIR